MLHKPPSAIPENTPEIIVGVLLSSFGAFWIGEGSAWNGSGKIGLS
jgi:uncharacterized membrane protein